MNQVKSMCVCSNTLERQEYAEYKKKIKNQVKSLNLFLVFF